ncbi:hypothetical protein JR064_00220 [Xanthomonas sp. CFBP 8703]|uniref:Uncharacterized protein n=1 Tax=Xanthomonas bonasiae TaxID=2810351 RepID=A0ABS3AZK8_9XANT|nr:MULTISPECIES: hypothetical protein [Xanthomonas]MBN6100591.1 hypothetical protein [Xanthomonas bonasiae]MBN6111382.1 hypothetical protein [Xanthomonas bonasiae]NYF18567.1 hypothetical protein [Xanthomonas sp. JAI131]
MANNRGELAAERALLFSGTDGAALREFKVRIFAPVLISPENTKFRVDEGAICVIELLGLAEPDIEIHGVDGVHALKQAADVDVVLEGVSRKNGYQFFWPSGEPYFEG